MVSSLLIAYELHCWFFMVSCTLNWVIAFTSMWSGSKRRLTTCHSWNLPCLVLIRFIRPSISVYSKSRSYCIKILHWYFFITSVNILPKGLALRHFPFPPNFSHFCFFSSTFRCHCYGNCLFTFCSDGQVGIFVSEQSWDENCHFQKIILNPIYLYGFTYTIYL